MPIDTINSRQPQLAPVNRSVPSSSKRQQIGLVASNNLIISVFEHQRLTVKDFSQASDFSWLLAQEFEVFSLKRQRGQWQLKVGHYIGIIMLPSGTTLEILPKPIATDHNAGTDSSSNHGSSTYNIALTRQWVQQMLSDLFDKENNRLPHRKNLAQISTNLQPLPSLPMQPLPLSEWLVKQFLQLLPRYQPAHYYQASVQNKSMLQGKLLIKEQLRRNAMQPHKFVSEVSSLSIDMLSNRLIKSALVLLEPLLARSSCSEHSNGSIKNLAAQPLLAWQAVTACNQYELRQLDSLYLSAKRQLAMQPLAREQLQSAQQLLEWAYWLLQRQQLAVQVGNSLRANNSALAAARQPRLCILFNMNQAFEQWASLRIAMSFAQLDNNYQTLYQAQHSWLRDKWGQTCLSIRPDLLIGKRFTSVTNSRDTNSVNGFRNNAHLNTNNNSDNAADQNNHYQLNDAQNAFNCSHVIDIKWKALVQPSSVSASDAYQLASYAQAYQAEQVWLVYPVANASNNNIHRPTVLKQHGATEHSNLSQQAELWLMPFNVLTATLNDWPLVIK